MDDFLRDVSYAIRMLFRNRILTAIATLTLGLGIGANSAIFSVVNAVLLRPLPVREPDRLATIVITNAKFNETAAGWKRNTRLFESVGAASPGVAELDLGPAVPVHPKK